MADVPAVERVIFSDPAVAKGLAHDISLETNRRRFAEEWCNDLGLDGDTRVWSEGGLAGYAILPADQNTFGANGLLGVTGFYGMEKKDALWTGEIFYALGSSYHGKGIMTEACQAVMDEYQRLPDAGDLYAVYWGLLNPASGRILRRLGFKEHGHKTLLAEYSDKRARSFGDFELWRLKNAKQDELEKVALEAATKLGHLCHERLLRPEEAKELLLEAIPSEIIEDSISQAIETGLERGSQTPGMILLLYSPR